MRFLSGYPGLSRLGYPDSLLFTRQPLLLSPLVVWFHRICRGVFCGQFSLRIIKILVSTSGEYKHDSLCLTNNRCAYIVQL